MAKPFLSYTQQLNNLATRKGLVINDTVKAETALHHVGYFSLHICKAKKIYLVLLLPFDIYYQPKALLHLRKN